MKINLAYETILKKVTIRRIFSNNSSLISMTASVSRHTTKISTLNIDRKGMAQLAQILKRMNASLALLPPRNLIFCESQYLFQCHTEGATKFADY